MEKFIRFGNIEVEILPDREYFNDARKESWGNSKKDLKGRGLRLPTLKELKYIHNLLYLNYGGNFEEGSEYWTSDIRDEWAEGSVVESRRTLIMNFRGTPSQKYIYSRMRYRGVRDI